jgi:hypothetical protein
VLTVGDSGLLFLPISEGNAFENSCPELFPTGCKNAASVGFSLFAFHGELTGA